MATDNREIGLDGLGRAIKDYRDKYWANGKWNDVETNPNTLFCSPPKTGFQSVTRRYKGKDFTMFAPPPGFSTGAKRLVRCQALEAIQTLATSAHDALPCSMIDGFISEMAYCDNTVYVPGVSARDSEYMAKFKDGSVLIWLGAYQEWGFRYGVDIDDPYIDVFKERPSEVPPDNPYNIDTTKLSPDTGSSHIDYEGDPSLQEGVQCG